MVNFDVRLSTLIGFNFGNARAIRAVAMNSSAIWTGLVLVVLTAIPRNYDQLYFRETPLWLFGPLLFSLLSGTFLYLVVARSFAGAHFSETLPYWHEWRSFMALFWMTAPIAWFYAIPVERFWDSYQAAQANLTLLAIVSIWRVLLFSRVLNVLWQVPFFRTLGWVVIAASIEVIVVFFLGLFVTASFSKRVLSGMSGMRNSPEEVLIVNTLGNVWGWSWVILILTAFILGFRRYYGSAQVFPASSPHKLPIVLWFLISIAWVWIAIPPQREQQRYFRHANLIEQSKFSEALNFLSQHQASAFPPGRRIRPDPFEGEVWTALPPTMALLTTNTPIWIRSLYLTHLSQSLRHYQNNFRSLSAVISMYTAIEKLPESRQWMAANQEALARQGFRIRFQQNPTTNSADESQLRDLLGKMGMKGSRLNEIF